jgi:signal transduction histidine kinase
LFGSHINDPLVHATVWSLGTNTFLFVLVSLLTVPDALERLQTAQFANVFKRAPSRSNLSYTATPEDLLILGQRILGRDEAMRLFNQESTAQGKTSGLPDATSEFITKLEREFTGSVGAATAHAMIGQVTGTEAVSVEELIAVADETAEIMEYSSQLETQSAELSDAADKLTQANNRLTILGAQKDAFLSQVSHELRTPMTSIRSFAEILRDSGHMDEDKRQRFSSIIHDESMRLTRLLDEILDLSFLESGRVQFAQTDVNLGEAVDRALLATETLLDQASAKVTVSETANTVTLSADVDRMSQIFINLITNALKYGARPDPEIAISCQQSDGVCLVDVIDNGPGIPDGSRDLIFEKFARLNADTEQGSAGLGLPISREIARTMGGELECIARDSGAHFRVTLPLAAP